MDEWMKNYPSVFVNRSYKGDKDYAKLYYGEGNKLLYQLKNLMIFRNLGQLKMTRISTDGTVITAKSVFGHDFINIDVSKAVIGLALSCTITFIDLPDIVQPMRYPGEIHEGEVEGIDYFKTYYSFDISECSTCQDIAWDFLFTYSEPVELRHYDDDPDNHSVYSFSPPCWGQIINHGRDEGGNYIIWKAYTETGDISRTGLGIMLLKAVISDDTTEVICSQQQKIDVDCCLKVKDLRKTIIYWRKCDLGEVWCPAPDIAKFSDLLYFWTYGGWVVVPLSLMAENGACIPLEWNIDGPGSIEIADEYGMNATYIVTMEALGASCREEIQLSINDRCGTKDVLTFQSCCDEASDVSISYTSLVMSCNGSQTLMASGGCASYQWVLSSGGGTLEVGPGGNYAIYTAPATNPSCVSNPTITLNDCCGKTAQVKLAVNCWTPNDASLRLCEQTVSSCECIEWYGGECTYFKFSGIFDRDDWNCAGELIYELTSTATDLGCNPDINPDCCMLSNCACSTCVPPFYCGTGYCNVGLRDVRTQDMKDGGCCPINPLTGLPY